MPKLDGFLNVGKMLESGVYALVWRREVVYVGKSKVMLTRIYSHRNAWGDKRQRKSRRSLPSWFPTAGILFDDVWVMPTPVHRLDEVEREMIARFRPRFNQLLVPKVPLPSLAQLGLGQRIERRV